MAYDDDGCASARRHSEIWDEAAQAFVCSCRTGHPLTERCPQNPAPLPVAAPACDPQPGQGRFPTLELFALRSDVAGELEVAREDLVAEIDDRRQQLRDGEWSHDCDGDPRDPEHVCSCEEDGAADLLARISRLEARLTSLDTALAAARAA